MTRNTQAPCAVVTRAKPLVFEVRRAGVIRVHFDKRLGQVRRQPRAFPGARHAVPLVADAAGIQTQRIIVRTSRRAARVVPAR